MFRSEHFWVGENPMVDLLTNHSGKGKERKKKSNDMDIAIHLPGTLSAKHRAVFHLVTDMVCGAHASFF
jgi:hypothetical protein